MSSSTTIDLDEYGTDVDDGSSVDAAEVIELIDERDDNVEPTPSMDRKLH